MTTLPDLSVIKAAAGARADLIELARKLADTGTELHDRKGSVIGYDVHWGDASDALVDLADALSATEALIARVEAAEANADRAFKNAAITMDELQAAEARVEKLEGALRPFAALADKFTGPMTEVCQPHPDNPSMTIVPLMVARFRAAREALTPEAK